MTTEEIKAQTITPMAVSDNYTVVFWLKEIALQLAKANELQHESNEMQKTMFNGMME